MKSAIFAAIIGFAHAFSPAPPVAKTTLARLCIPTEFWQIPAEFRHKAPAVPVPDRNRHRNVL